MKINDMQNQIANARNEMYNISNNTSNEVSAIYSNVDNMLKQEMSLIEQASTEIGKVNVETHTVNITFSLVPKEVNEDSVVSLDFDGEICPMNRNGTMFTATVTRDFFSSATPLIVIDENGITKTTQDGRIGVMSIKDSVLPVLTPILSGSSGYGGGMYRFNGNLYVDAKAITTDITFTDIRLVTKVDGNMITEDILSSETSMTDWPVDKKIPVGNGQVLVMTVVATNSLGYEHHYTVAHWVGGSDAQREPWFRDERIYSADGNLLWGNEPLDW